MSKSIYASLASILLLSACQKDNQDTSVSTKAHGYKPKVAIDFKTDFFVIAYIIFSLILLEL